MSWDTAQSPKFPDAHLFPPVDDASEDERTKSIRNELNTGVQLALSRKVQQAENDNLAAELPAILEHRYWITIILAFTRGELRNTMIDFLIDFTKIAYSEPERFAKIHFNLPLLLGYWRGLETESPEAYRSLFDQGNAGIKKHLQSLSREGNIRDVVWKFGGKTMRAENKRGFESLAELEEKRRIYATAIFEDYRRLQKIVVNYGEKLKHRWYNSWDAKKRRDGLSQAWKDSWVDGEEDSEYTKEIPNNKRMDLMFDLHFDTSLDKESRVARKHFAYWFPFISIEELKDEQGGKNVCKLIFSRASISPDRFIMGDGFQGNASNVFHNGYPEVFALYYGMKFFLKGEEIKQGEMKYGEIIPLRKDSFANGRALPCSWGLEVLSLQSRIYSFLVRLSKAILGNEIKDVDLDELELKDLPPTLGSAELSTEDPVFFRAAGRVEDIQEMTDLIEAKRSMAATHMRCLREEPQYFHDRFNELVQHQPDYLTRRSRGNPGPGGRVPIVDNLPKSRDLDMDQIRLVARSDLIFMAFRDIVVWEEISTKFQDLQKLLSDDPDWDTRDRLDPKLSKALSELKSVLVQNVMAVFGLHFSQTLSSTTFRGHFALLSPAWFAGVKDHAGMPGKHNPLTVWLSDGSPNRFALLSGGQTVEKPYCWVSSMLTKLVAWHYHPTDNQLLQEIFRKMNKGGEDGNELRKLLTGLVHDGFEDLYLLSECYTQIIRFQSWSVTNSFGFDEDCKPVTASETATTGLRDYIRNHVDSKESKLGEYTAVFPDKDFQYPKSKYKGRKTKDGAKVTARLQEVEQALDAFWAEVDVFMGAKDGVKIPDEAFPVRSAGCRTPNWGTEESVETPEDPKPSPERKIEHGESPGTKKRKAEGEGEVILKKAKTRPAPSGEEEEPEVEPEAEPEAAPELPKITVSGKHKELFDNILKNPGLRGRRQQVTWDDFAGAMTTIGFSIDATVGSAFRFTPQSEELVAILGARPIVFHKPHAPGSGNKLGSQVVNNIALRLDRAYGLVADRFEKAT